MKKKTDSNCEAPRKRPAKTLKKQGSLENSQTGPGRGSLKQVSFLLNSKSNDWQDTTGAEVGIYRHSYLLRLLTQSLLKVHTSSPSAIISIHFSHHLDGDILSVSISGDQNLQKMAVYTIIYSVAATLIANGWVQHGIEFLNKQASWTLTFHSKGISMHLLQMFNGQGPLKGQ